MPFVSTPIHGIIGNYEFTDVGSAALKISAISGEAVDSTTGRITISVNKACTFRFRFKSSGPVTTKGVTPTGDFPPTFIFTVEAAGTYSFIDNSNPGS